MQQDIPTAVHYPVGMHQQKAMHKFPCAHQTFAHTEDAAQSVMSLPFYPSLQMHQVHLIAEHVESTLTLGV